jgi:putative peptidoglycan lipid II flippase
VLNSLSLRDLWAGPIISGYGSIIERPGGDISHQPTHSANSQALVEAAESSEAFSASSVSDTMTPTTPKPQKWLVAQGVSSKRRFVWGGRTFRFNLQNFRMSEGLALRRFSIVEASFIIILALLTSHVLGIVREVTFAAMFDPASSEVKAYIASFRLPTLLYNLIAGGALVNAFVPVFLSAEKQKGEYEAWRLVSLLFNVVLVIFTGSIFVCELLTPELVNHFLVSGFSSTDQAMTTALTRVMLVQPLILGLATILTAVLNSKRQFLLPALSLTVYNVGLIGGLVVAKFVPGVGIYGPTYGVVVAAALQFAVLMLGLRKQRVHYFFTWDLRNPYLRQVFILFLPNALAIGIASISSIADTNFSSLLQDPNSLAALHNASLFQALPLGLVAAVAQSLLPQLTIHASARRYIRMRQTAWKVMGVATLFTLPFVIAFIIIGRPLIYLLFQHGAFTPHAAELTYLALLGYVFSIPGMAIITLMPAAFYALQDALTPFLCNMFSLLLHMILLFLLFYVIQGPAIIFAIPLAIAGSCTAEAVLQYLLLFYRLRKRVRLDEGMRRLQRRRLNKKQAYGTLHGS